MANGLLGMGGFGGSFGAQPPAGLLGKYFNKTDMRNQQIKQGLLNAGIGMLQGGKGSTGEVLGNSLAAGLQGANNAGLNYKADAMGYQQLETQMNEQKEKERNKAAVMQWLDGLPEDQQELARVNPQMAAEAYMKQQFAGASEGFTLGEGQQRFDAMGRPIATGPTKEAAKPAGIQEYEYAKQQGFPGTFSDWEASKRGGMSLVVDPATGAMTFQQGSNIKPLTESQSKDTVFSTRAKGAMVELEKNSGALTSYGDSIVSGAPVIGNALVSEPYQKAAQAGKEFLQAILRKDTGAAITKEETAEYGSVYLPQPGDSEGTQAQKKLSRQRAVAALEAGMTPQAILAQEKALLQTGQGPAGPAPAAPKVRKYNPATGKLE